MVLRFLLIILLAVQTVLSVRVSLERGATEKVDKEVTEGTNPTLACSFSVSQGGSQANAEVEWRYSATSNVAFSQHIVHGGKVVDPFVDQFVLAKPSSLTINNVDKNNKGFYICSVTILNDFPSQAFGIYNLTVLVKPSVPVCQFPSDRVITIGFSTQFFCQSSEGVPYPTYTWYKNQLALPEMNAQSSALWSNTSFSYSPTSGTLTFASVVPGDAGTYYCVSHNKVGEAQCVAVEIVTKSQNIGLIVGIVLGGIFVVVLLAVLVWWGWRKGCCDNVCGKWEPDEVEDEESNNYMLDRNGPVIYKPASVTSGSTGRQENL